MKEWWNKLSANGQNVYLMRHPGSALKATKDLKPVDLPKDFDKSKYPDLVKGAQKAFESVDPYKAKIASFGKKKITEYATRIKEALKSDTSKQAISVAGEILFKLGLLTLGAGAMLIGADPVVLLNPFFIQMSFEWLSSKSDVAKTIANKTANDGRVVLDFCEGIFQGIREGIKEHKNIDKAFIKDDHPPQIFIGKKPETASNFSNKADITRAYAKLRNNLIDLEKEIASIPVTPFQITRAINVQSEVSDIDRRITMMLANYPSLSIEDTNKSITKISTKIKQLLSQGKAELSSYIPRNLVKDVYVTHLQEQTSNFSFIRRATIAELATETSNVFVAIESASTDSITASISDVREQLPHLFETYSIAQFKVKLKDNIYGKKQ